MPHSAPRRLFTSALALLALFATLLAPLATPALVQASGPGTLDTTFGTNGIASTYVAPGINPNGSTVPLVQQADNKIVLAARLGVGSNNSLGLVRYSAAGVLDTSFGSSGSLVSAPFSNSVPASIALQSTGAIVVAGYANAGGYDDFLLARYTSAGVLDTTFNSTGVITTAITPFTDRIDDMVVDGSDRIVVAGFSNPISGRYNFTVARYTSAGVLDTTFNSTGVITTPVGFSIDTPTALAIQPDGKIVLAGYVDRVIAGTHAIALVRYTSSGILDSTFGTNGVVKTNVGSNNLAYSMAIAADGTILVAGTVDGAATLLRYTTAGALDSTFGTNGVVDVSPSFTTSPNALKLVGNTIILGGSVSSHWLLARYTAAGTLDTSFGTNGTTTLAPSGVADSLASLDITSAGKLLAVGTANDGSTNKFAIARLNLVGDAPISGLTASNDGPTIRGNATQLSANITAGTNVSYSWDFGDGSAAGSGASVSHTYAASGVYTASVTASNSAGSVPATTQVTVTPRTYTLTVAKAGTGSGTVGGGGTFAENTLVTPTATPDAGSSLASWAPLSCGSAFTLITDTLCTATFSLIPPVEVAISGLAANNDSPTPAGTVVLFTATVSAGTNISYTWSFGDGATGSGASTSHSYASDGTYTAAVTATNSLGSASATTVVTIDPAPTTRYVAPTGSNTGTCANPAVPCLSIGYALGQANPATTDVISVTAGVYTEQLLINKSIQIIGSGAATTIVQAAAAPRSAVGRVFTITSGKAATIEGLTIRNGAELQGGGVRNDGTLTLRRVTVLNNIANSGGGIYNAGTLTLDTSTVISNTAQVITSTQGLTQALLLPARLRDLSGGNDQGRWPIPLGEKTIPITGLLLLLAGVALAATKRIRPRTQAALASLAGLLLLAGCAITPQYDGQGGGIFNAKSATLTITGSTIARNSAQGGGGIFTADQYTVSRYQNGPGGITQVQEVIPGGTTTIDRSLLAGNDGGSCAGRSVASGGFNLASDASCAFGQVGDQNSIGDARLGSFGGTVIALLADSPAIGAGSCVISNGAVLPDQAGTPRPQGSQCDVGASERIGTPQPYLAISARSAHDRPPATSNTSQTILIENQGAADATSLSLSYTPPTGFALAGPVVVSGGGGVTGAAPTILSGVTLAAGTSISVTIPLHVTAAEGTALTNTFVAANNTTIRSVTTQFVSIVGPAPGTDRFVDASAGVDSGSCTDATHPCKTITYALTKVQRNDIIAVAPGTYTEVLTVNALVTIKGSGADKTIIQAATSLDLTKTVISVFSPGDLTLDGFTVRNGRSGIYSDAATLTIRNSIISGNRGSGGIDNSYGGTLTINNSTISDNSVSYGDGGGIDNSYGTLTINNSTISGNSASYGGGIFSRGILTINNSTISGNSASNDGGGIFNGGYININGIMTISNSVISGNYAAEDGGGIMNIDMLTINNSTVSSNTAPSDGGGIFNYTPSVIMGDSSVPGGGTRSGYRGATMAMSNTIVVGNIGDSIIRNRTYLTAISNSILQESWPGNDNQVETDPTKLFVRAPGTNGTSDFGNLHAKFRSPAIGRGAACLTSDYDGRTRSARCTIGAYEYVAATLNPAAARRATLSGNPETWSVTTTDGPITLIAPSAAVTQSVTLELSLAEATGGAGRIQAVRLTAHDPVSGQELAGFSFNQPLTITLAYSPTLVPNGQEDQLILEQFNPLTGGWQPNPNGITTVDKVAQTVTTQISAPGDYGLFVLPRTVSIGYQVFSPVGPNNLRAGDTVTYTLLLYNGSDDNASDLSVSAQIPAGVTFGNWVEQGSAAQVAGTIIWPVAYLARGGFQQISFAATIGSSPALQGQILASTASLTGADGGSATAAISVNGPPSADAIVNTTMVNTPITILPLLYVSNADLSPLTLSAVSTPSHGSASISNGVVTYTPAPGYFGTDSFTYMVQDGPFTTSNSVTVIVGYQTFLPLVAKP